MQTRRDHLRTIVGSINRPEDDGGFWLPHIQRAFVWSEDQICRLFDSIMREYPISTLLVWKTKKPVQCRRFIDAFKDEYRERLSAFYAAANDRPKSLVLDGQQRLQSLYIGLKGTYEGKELHFDVLSGEGQSPDDVKYQFRFINSKTAEFPWTKFSSLVFSDLNPFALANSVVAASKVPLSASESERVWNNVGQVFKTFCAGSGISYQELDSIEHPNLYSDEDIVEVFIRANSGGTKLGKSDLLFSLLAAGWDTANEEIESLLDETSRLGFELNRDFVLKTCLTLVGQKAAYEVEKFRKPGVREEILRNWSRISESILEVLSFVTSKTFIKCDKALPSYNILIPLTYLRYRHHAAWNSASGLESYLLRSSLAGAFGGRPDQLIDAIVARLDRESKFDLEQVFDVVRTQGRSLELTEERFWRIGYGSDTIHLLFNLWYRGFNYTPGYANGLPQVDHIFPQSALKEVKELSPHTGRPVMRYREDSRNQLANCQLLTAHENGFTGKSGTLPSVWLDPAHISSRASMFGPEVPKVPEEYYELHLIPRDPALWQLDRFPDFIEARKALIRERFAYLLVPPTDATDGGPRS